MHQETDSVTAQVCGMDGRWYNLNWCLGQVSKVVEKRVDYDRLPPIRVRKGEQGHVRK